MSIMSQPKRTGLSIANDWSEEGIARIGIHGEYEAFDAEEEESEDEEEEDEESQDEESEDDGSH